MLEVKDTQKLDEVLSHYRSRSEELIPILQETQEKFNYLPPETLKGIAKFLKVPESTVFGVATFYAQFRLVPTGKKIVRVCRGTACHVRGSARILDEVQRQLGIKPGETTADMEYTLETVACFGSCALAPVMVVDDKVNGRMTTSKVGQILGKKQDTKE